MLIATQSAITRMQFVCFSPEVLALYRQALARTGHDLWSVPGGKVEWGEAVADACRREVHEETGVEVTIGPLVTWIERIDASHHYVILDFLGTPVRDPVLQRAGDDAADARWVTDDQLLRLPLTEGLLPVLEQARALLRR
jgi:8-oxo-dGTP diphosphatase